MALFRRFSRLVDCSDRKSFLSYKRGIPTNVFMDNLSFHVAIVAAALFILIKNVGNKEKGVVPRFCSLCSKDFFGVYLIHPLFLMFIDIPQIRDCYSHIITIPLISVIVFVLSLFATKLMRRIPLLHKFVE